MIDPDFYHIADSMTVQELAQAGQANLVRGDDAELARSLAAAHNAVPGDITFIESTKESDLAVVTGGICFAPKGAADNLSDAVSVIECSHPRWSFSQAASSFAQLKPGWDAEGNAISPQAVLEDGVVVAPNVVIGPNARIGRGTIIEPGVYIGTGVTIGRNCRIGPQTSIKCGRIGDNVTLLAGVKIGEAGFGLSAGPQGLLDTPHFGRAIIQDDVSIGANTTVDRGLFDDTLIALGVKIDNLCQIAHNVQVGAHSVIAAFGGISGSVVIGEGCMLGGRSGIADHKTMGPGSRLAAGAASMNDIPAGETWGGYLAKPIRTWMRETAWVSKQVKSRK